MAVFPDDAVPVLTDDLVAGPALRVVGTDELEPVETEPVEAERPLPV